MEDFKSKFTNERFSTEYHAFLNPKTSSKNQIPVYIFGSLVLSLSLFAFLKLDVFSYYFLISVNIIFLINFVFKFFLFGIYLNSTTLESPVEEIENLPIYTILLPCYKEKEEVLQELIKAMCNFNYPAEKLDIKFLLEASDLETIKVVQNLKHNFEILIVPNVAPKTKPKACNFGLYNAVGEFVVIFDAEDRPEPDQLLKALTKFKNSDKSLICVQAMLNFYNTERTWLSKSFSIEYLIWFNAFLPALAKLKFFIPLGGTSNHFKTKELIKIGGWDSFNVTEDAELGIRICKNGYEVDVIKSYTLEEAPIYLENWILQRTRWQKGFLQTFLIHISDFQGNKNLSFLNFINIFLTVGLSFFSFFLIPLTAVFFIENKIEGFLAVIFSINIISNLIYIMMFFCIIKKENMHSLTKVAFFMPFYFLFHIFSSHIAFFEIFVKPFYWHKTKHGA
jgi:cellulose synthase/poly-beta-1,6-N-acetylglucosamine synthase-like glycosyltransferase